MGINLETIGGGLSMDLLWTNSNPTANFSPQKISAPVKDYDIIVIFFIGDINSNAKRYYPPAVWFRTEFYSITSTGCVLQASPETNRYRTADMSNDGITFGAGYSVGSVYNQICVPVFVYGIKL